MKTTPPATTGEEKMLPPVAKEVQSNTRRETFAYVRTCSSELSRVFWASTPNIALLAPCEGVPLVTVGPAAREQEVSKSKRHRHNKQSREWGKRRVSIVSPLQRLPGIS